MSYEIHCVAVLDDNYVWLLRDKMSGEVAVVDPALAGPVLAAAMDLGWNITQIWNTHWHSDHVGGNVEIKRTTGATIFAPAREAEKIPQWDTLVGEDTQLRLGALEVTVIDVPGHTAGHVAFYLPAEGLLFSGDTLFAMGCGRLFEGTADQMWTNMERLAALPETTSVYCAHEYTLANARFAVAVEPSNPDIATRFEEVKAARELGIATIPTTIGAEKRTNPFMTAGSLIEFANRRLRKDTFA